MSKIKALAAEFHAGMRLFAELVAAFFNTVLLFVVYVIGVGITTVIARIGQKELLTTTPDDTDSYWEKVTYDTSPYRQF